MESTVPWSMACWLLLHPGSVLRRRVRTRVSIYEGNTVYLVWCQMLFSVILPCGLSGQELGSGVSIRSLLSPTDHMDQVCSSEICLVLVIYMR